LSLDGVVPVLVEDVCPQQVVDEEEPVMGEEEAKGAVVSLAR
jgi:hypothetical protein